MACSPLDFSVRLTFESDWHVGTGAGTGYVDRLVTRDADGLPYVPAKTLTGLWRDGCERLAWALDERKQCQPWVQWVDFLFGEQPALRPSGTVSSWAPRPAALAIRSARFDPSLRDALRSLDPVRREKLLQSFTFLKPGVAINPGSGRALDKHLRFIEMARADASFVSSISLGDLDDEERLKDAAALLLAGAALVERLGGKRRRGSGKCRLKLEIKGDLPFGRSDEATAWLSQRPCPLPVPEPRPPKSLQTSTTPSSTPPSSGASCGTWYRIPLRLVLLDPLLVHKQTVGNVVETHDFLPGTLILKKVLDLLEARGCSARAAAVAGDLIVLPATIELDGAAGRPVPLAVHRHKDGGGFDKAGTIHNRLLDAGTDKTLKPFRSGFIGPTNLGPSSSPFQLPMYRSIETIVRAHNTVDDEPQRPTERVGGLYSLEALPAGLTMVSEIRVREPLFDHLSNLLGESSWNELLEGNARKKEWRLGRTSKDDYGLVRVTTEILDWSEPCWDGRVTTIDGAEVLIAWLLSDTLLRGTSLRPDPTPEALLRELEARLAVSLELAPARTGCPAVFSAARRHESWQVSWGLPRPTLLALRAGSCFCFKVTGGTLDPKRLAELEVTGLGERRCEGFGQVRFNDRLLTSADKALKDWVPSPHVQQDADVGEPKLVPSYEECSGFAGLVEREAWRNEIRRGAVRIAADPGQRTEHLGLDLEHGKPSMSQLGGLRTALAWAGNDREPVLRWLAGVHHDRWPEKSLERVTKLISDPAVVWSAQILGADAWPTLTEDGSLRLRQELWFEAVQGLFDACIRAHKRGREPVRTPGTGRH